MLVLCLRVCVCVCAKLTGAVFALSSEVASSATFAFFGAAGELSSTSFYMEVEREDRPSIMATKRTAY